MTNSTGDNLTLAELTPEDWSAAEQLADVFGISSVQLVGDFWEEFGRLTPEERAEFERAVEQASEVLPQMQTALERIGHGLSHCRSAIRQLRQQTSEMSRRLSRIEARIASEISNG